MTGPHTEELWELESPPEAHLCVMSTNHHAVDDNRLVWSEVLSLARLALYRLNKKARDDRLITPVSNYNS
jgi:hypothetical protein